MRSRSDDRCQADVYIQWWKYGPNIVAVWCVVILKWTWAQKCKANLTKSVADENEVKVKWHVSGWHVHLMNAWTKYSHCTTCGYSEMDLSMKLLSISCDRCQADMYIPWWMYGPNIVAVWCVVIQKWTWARKCDANLTKSVDHENEVKDKWQVSGWYVHPLLNAWTKYSCCMTCSHSEMDLNTKMWRKFNEVSGPWKWGQGHVSVWYVHPLFECVDQIWLYGVWLLRNGWEQENVMQS